MVHRISGYMRKSETLFRKIETAAWLWNKRRVGLARPPVCQVNKMQRLPNHWQTV